MLKIYRVLGKKGRITIPFVIRQRIGFRYNDVLSFTQQDDGSVVVRKEKICDKCNELAEEYEKNYTLEDFLDSLSEEEQRDALVHLSLKWVENRMLVYRLRLPKRSDYQLVFKNLWTFQILWIYLLLKGRR